MISVVVHENELIIVGPYTFIYYREVVYNKCEMGLRINSRAG
jgi:hypothetical protein